MTVTRHDACPEREMRAAMSDGQFWEHVLQPDAALYPEEPDVDPQVRAQPCPECGEHGACAWDSEGRPLIHATTAEDDR